MSPRLRASLSLSAVFVLGAATGSAVTRAATARAMHELHAAPRNAARRHLILASLDHRLSLSPEQRARIDAILTSHDGEFTAIARHAEPEVAPLVSRIQGEIRETLTPEQLPKYDEMTARFNERRRRDLGESP